MLTVQDSDAWSYNVAEQCHESSAFAYFQLLRPFTDCSEAACRVRLTCMRWRCLLRGSGVSTPSSLGRASWIPSRSRAHRCAPSYQSTSTTASNTFRQRPCASPHAHSAQHLFGLTAARKMLGVWYMYGATPDITEACVLQAAGSAAQPLQSKRQSHDLTEDGEESESFGAELRKAAHAYASVSSPAAGSKRKAEVIDLASSDDDDAPQPPPPPVPRAPRSSHQSHHSQSGVSSPARAPAPPLPPFSAQVSQLPTHASSVHIARRTCTLPCQWAAGMFDVLVTLVTQQLMAGNSVC